VMGLNPGKGVGKTLVFSWRNYSNLGVWWNFSDEGSSEADSLWVIKSFAV